MECAHLETLTWLSQADLNELVKRSSKTKNVLKCKGEAPDSPLNFCRVRVPVWIGIQRGRRLKQIAERTCTNFQNLYNFTPKFTTDLLQIYIYDDLQSS